MLIPYNTDAPLYHLPLATVGLIAVNIVAFVGELQNPEAIEPYLLQFGNGLSPVQWVTNNFLHADLMHLLGNMFFLWGFGLVVEGKLGWWKFLLLYLAICILYGAAVQTMMLGGEGDALGASGAIFGLIAIALVWAPKNEMNCILVVSPLSLLGRLGGGGVDIPIAGFAALYLIMNFVFAWLQGFAMSSEVLHLTGAAVGAGFGLGFLKLDWVDCEGWDALSVWSGKNSIGLISERDAKLLAEAEQRAKKAAAPPPPISQDKAEFVAGAIRSRLSTGDAAGALQVYQKQRTAHSNFGLSEPDLLGLIKALHKQQLWSPAIRPMVDYIRQFPERATKMRLKLAEILLAVESRPAKALTVLSQTNLDTLPPDLRAIHAKMTSRAKQQLEQGDIEVSDGESW